MSDWLYRYVFRGIGIVMMIGMITILFVTVNSQIHRKGTNSTAVSAGTRR